MKSIVQQVWDTPRGVLLLTTKASYLQNKVVELHYQGYTPSEISFFVNKDTDFVEEAIEEYAYVN